VLCKACSYQRGNSKAYQEVEWRDSLDGKDCRKSVNFSPTMYGPVMISKKLVDPSSAPEERVIQPMMWGMVPPWHVVCISKIYHNGFV
jgi:putative SOS response-associated peptidase YedK